MLCTYCFSPILMYFEVEFCFIIVHYVSIFLFLLLFWLPTCLHYFICFLYINDFLKFLCYCPVMFVFFMLTVWLLYYVRPVLFISAIWNVKLNFHSFFWCQEDDKIGNCVFFVVKGMQNLGCHSSCLLQVVFNICLLLMIRKELLQASEILEE